MQDQLVADPTEADKLLQLDETMVQLTKHFKRGTGSPQDLKVLILAHGGLGQQSHTISVTEISKR